MGVTNEAKRERKKRAHNPISEKRLKNKSKRMLGLVYTGFSTKNKKIKQDIIKRAREIGPACSSEYCKKLKERHCKKFDQVTRSTIFESFWELPWSAKQILIQCLVKKMPPKKSSVENSRKKHSFKFFLYLNGNATQVFWSWS